MKRLRKILIISLSAILAFVLIIHPIFAVVLYEAIFSVRYEPSSKYSFSLDHFDSLEVERVELLGEGERLVGFKYSNPTVEKTNGLVVFSHGLGGGGHTPYLPLVDAFTDLGSLVFTYDATGNGESGGKDTNGLPQGPIDLERAISTALSDPEYSDLPLYLVGHSWGAYSVGIALGNHPEVKGAVMFAGFDSSSDMMEARAADYAGKFLTSLASPVVDLYERVKFGDCSTLTVTDSIAATDARVMIVHSKDDKTVPPTVGYEKYYESFEGDTRVTFLLYENRGHNRLYYSNWYKIDDELMSRITEMFDAA